MLRKSHLVFVFALTVLILAYQQGEGRHYVHLRIFYESLCSDSKNFINEQVLPAVLLLNRYMDIDFIPFGKCNRIRNTTQLICQHGPKECLGNKVQACALELMKTRADDIRVVKYVSCELTTKASTRNDLTCVRKAGVNERIVQACLENEDGDYLMRRHERSTKLLNPTFIPTITFDGVFDKEVQELSLLNLIRTVCSYFDYSVKQCKVRLKSYQERQMQLSSDS